MATMQRSVRVWGALALGLGTMAPTLRSRRAALLAVPALLGTVFAGYVFYIQTNGQVSPYTNFPYYAAAWCLFALACVLARPRLARAMGEKLIAELHVVPDSLADSASAVAAPPAAEPRR
jgi:hypothetical protein